MSGIVVSSSSPCVAARCAHVRAGVGAAPRRTSPTRGWGRGYSTSCRGRPPADAIAAALADEPHSAYRQLTVVTLAGQTAVFSGERTLGLYGSSEGEGAVAAGNLLANADVPQPMVEAFGSPPAIWALAWSRRWLPGSRPVARRGRCGQPGCWWPIG